MDNPVPTRPKQASFSSVLLLGFTSDRGLWTAFSRWGLLARDLEISWDLQMGGMLEAVRDREGGIFLLAALVAGGEAHLPWFHFNRLDGLC